MGWHEPESFDAPSSPAASSRGPVLALGLLQWTALPLQASVGSKLRTAAHGLTLRLTSDGRYGFDGADVGLGHSSAAITLGVYGHLFKPDDRAAAVWRQYSADDFGVKGGHGDGYPHERRNLAPQKFGEKIPHHHREFHSQALRPLGDERLHQALIATPEHAGHPVRDNRRRESCAEGCWWRCRMKLERKPSCRCQSGANF